MTGSSYYEVVIYNVKTFKLSGISSQMPRSYEFVLNMGTLSAQKFEKGSDGMEVCT